MVTSTARTLAVSALAGLALATSPLWSETQVGSLSCNSTDETCSASVVAERLKILTDADGYGSFSAQWLALATDEPNLFTDPKTKFNFTLDPGIGGAVSERFSLVEGVTSGQLVYHLSSPLLAQTSLSLNATLSVNCSKVGRAGFVEFDFTCSRSKTIEITMKNAQREPSTTSVNAGGPYERRSTVTIRGRVVGVNTNQPARSNTVYVNIVSPLGPTIPTLNAGLDEKGEFEARFTLGLDDLPGTYQVTAEYPGDAYMEMSTATTSFIVCSPLPLLCPTLGEPGLILLGLLMASAALFFLHQRA